MNEEGIFGLGSKCYFTIKTGQLLALILMTLTIRENSENEQSAEAIT